MELIITTRDEIKDIFLEALSTQNKIVQPNELPKQPQHLHSLKALAEFLGWSIQKVQREKNRGSFPYIQNGRKCFFDSEEILKALANKKRRIA
jgi:hypothetical protein